MPLATSVRFVVTLTITHFIFCCHVLNVSIAEDWPRWRGPRGDGSWRAPKIADKWPDEGLPVKWKQPIGPGYSGISVKAGRVYTMDRPADPANVERVVCFDAATGRTIWSHSYQAEYDKLDYGKGPRTTPTVDDGRVYTLGAVGHLHCLDAATGELLWAKNLKTDHRATQPTWGFAAMPIVYGDKVIVHAGLQPRGCYVAYDRKTGAEIWRGGDDPTGYGTPIVIQHAGAEQLIGWTPEHIVGLSLDDGKPLWQQPYKVTYGVTITTPIFQDGTVLVCGYWEGSKAIRLGKSASQADLLWEENRQLRGVMSQPLCRDGYVYLLDKSHGLVCFELATGKVRWTDDNRLTPRDRNPQANLVWLGDSNRAIALNAAGELLLVRLTPERFEELSRAKVIGETWAHPAFAGDSMFARDDSQIIRVKISAD